MAVGYDIGVSVATSSSAANTAPFNVTGGGGGNTGGATRAWPWWAWLIAATVAISVAWFIAKAIK